MHQIRLPQGLRPRLHSGGLRRSLDPISCVFEKPSFKGKELKNIKVGGGCTFLQCLLPTPIVNRAVYSSAALAEGSRADCIQTSSPRVQVSTLVRTRIPFWRALSDGICRGSSATPFPFILMIDCQPLLTTYCRWPSFPGRRCTCLELSAGSCYFRTVRGSLPVPA